MATLGTQLGQLRPADTNAASVYSPAADVTTEVTSIVIANTTALAAAFRLFLDDNGTTYDQTTALYYDHSVAANDSITLPESGVGGWWMADSTGNLAFRTDTANALTITVFGTEEQS